MTAAAFDVIVIGSGPGGYRAAVLLSLQNKRVAIIEKATWGGCCLNRGCVPKKDWHHTAQIMVASEKFAQRGLLGRLQPDLLSAWRHQQQVVQTVRENYVNYLQRLGVKRYEGHGRMTGPTTVTVEGKDATQLRARHIILATGSHSVFPNGVSAVENRIIDTDALFDQPPPEGARVAILGSGVIATEFAFILQQLGKEIHWFARSDMLSRTAFSDQARRLLRQALKSSGVQELQTRWPNKISVTADGVQLQFDDGTEQQVDWVLVATGRRPYTDGLGLEQAAVQTNDRGFVVSNEFLQTTQAEIYAIGDCTSEAMTANQALADATVVVSNIVHGNQRKQNPLWVPQLIYSALELARTGMNEDQAEDEGFEPAVGFAAFESSPRALGQDDAEGFVRLLADMDSGEFLGAELVGAEVGELIHLLGCGEHREKILQRLAAMPFNHPSRAEEILNALETMAGKWGLSDFIFAPNEE